MGGKVRPEGRPPVLDRRRWLKVSAGVLPGGWAAACASRPEGTLRATPPWTPLRPVKVSRDRVIRVVAGLRPYRAEGFVVRAERLAGKLLVHNYGHGGGGVTLSWGTAEMAADRARVWGPLDRQLFPARKALGVRGLHFADPRPLP